MELEEDKESNQEVLTKPKIKSSQMLLNLQKRRQETGKSYESNPKDSLQEMKKNMDDQINEIRSKMLAVSNDELSKKVFEFEAKLKVYEQLIEEKLQYLEKIESELERGIKRNARDKTDFML